MQGAEAATRRAMEQHEQRPTFRLRKGSKKDVCPNCFQKRFVPYVDENGEPAPHDGQPFGRCDRQNKCGFHRKPWEHGDADGWRRHAVVSQPPRVVRKQKKYMNAGLIAEHDRPNTFTNWIHDAFGADVLANLKQRFDMGTLQMHGREYAIFWQTDEHGNIHTGKAIPYEVRNGEPRRVRTGFGGAFWMHKTLKPAPSHEEWTQRPFGLRQLEQMPGATVGVVESEKTAVLCAAVMPALAWVAVGGCANLTAYDNECTVIEALKGRRVLLFPDSDAVEDWATKADVLAQNGFDVTVDVQWMEALTPDQRAEGLDLGDVVCMTLKREG
jgi:hypothetical protein